MAKLATPYVLPFGVFHADAPLFSSGGDVRLEVELAQVASAEAIDGIEATVIAFVQLATTGALAGPVLPPWNSTIADHTFALATAENKVVWVFNGCMLDELALIVLVHMLLDPHEAYAIRTVVLSTPTRPLETHRLAHDPDLEPYYPAAFVKVPFSWQVSEDAMDDIEVRARFRMAPDAEKREAVTDTLLTWAAAVAMGAYPVEPELPRDCGMVISPEDVDITGDELVMAITSFRAHPDALLGLVNVFASLSNAVVEVAQLDIE